MKRFSALFSLLLITSVVSACRTSVEITDAPVSPTATSSSAIQTTLPSPTPSPQPTPSIDLNRFDMVLNPPIVVGHTPPLIARSDEMVELKFNLLCAFASSNEPGSDCNLEATLSYTYGANTPITAFSLSKETQEEGEYWVAKIKAADSNGASLQYYLEVEDHQNNLKVRYPLEGMLSLQVVDKFQSIQVTSQPTFETGELILALPWGDSPQSVGMQQREGYPLREGPMAFDVAPDGRLAILDAVNERVFSYNTQDQTITFLPLPFTYKSQADLKFNQNGRLAILDIVGEPEEQGANTIPGLYLLAEDGSVQTSAPVYVTWPSRLTGDLTVLDEYDGLLVMPISATGNVNSQEDQYLNKVQPDLCSRFADGLFPYVAHFGDRQAETAFELHSDAPLGAITHFEKAPQGYIAVFSADQIQAIWFTPEGEILQNIVLPNEQYTEIPSLRQVTIDQYGAIYILQSTAAGLEIRFVHEP